MSRDDAPNYRVHDCCFHCQFAFIGYDGVDKCTKHNFQFDAGGDGVMSLAHGSEATARVCNDFKRWTHEPRWCAKF